MTAYLHVRICVAAALALAPASLPSLPWSFLLFPHQFSESFQVSEFLNLKRGGSLIEGPQSVKRRCSHACLDCLVDSADVHPEAGLLRPGGHQLCAGRGQRGPGLLRLRGHPHPQRQPEGEGASR